ncbi:MAG: GIY-YIG nuclease family protein [Sediminibacterium sp.]
MGHYVYIIESEQDGTFYKGYSQDPSKRLQQHNQGESKFTSGKMPWKLVYVEECGTKREALIRERNMKKAERSRIQHLLSHPKNIIGRFTGG